MVCCAMPDVVREINELVDARYRESRVILLGGVAAAWQATVNDLRRRGAESFLVVHSGAGTGAAPSGDDVMLVDVEVAIQSGEIIEEFRVWTRLAAEPPDHVAQALDRFDPDLTAVVLCTFPTPLDQFAGRTVHGGRHPAWVALEDKVLVDDLLDRASVAHPPSSVVRVVDAPAAAQALDQGTGTVWAGDSREGFNGGATRVRWIVTDAEAREAVDFFASEHDLVRVSPFVEGVPCSIHGIVGATGIAVFRPCEMLIMRTADHRFVYCGVATAWDPAPIDRESMREAARRVGELLRSEVDFRGTFTLDGIMSTDGFVATEVNPRFGGGMARIAGGIDDLPVLDLHRELIADPQYDPDADAIERVVLESADQQRSFTAWSFLSTPISETTTFRFVVEGGEAVAVTPGAAAIEATVGPAVTGSMLRVDLTEIEPLVGAMFAPLAVEALREAAALAGVALPDLEAARSVR